MFGCLGFSRGASQYARGTAMFIAGDIGRFVVHVSFVSDQHVWRRLSKATAVGPAVR